MTKRNYSANENFSESYTGHDRSWQRRHRYK
ncbi:protein of unknown function [Stenotrophomonas maltophilia]|nr:protein of unknown function [Stenotrophomonas maltophilia]